MGTNGVKGIIISLEASVIDRVFHHRPIIPLFVRVFPSDLAVGDATFLYEKGGGRVLEGEGTITEISSETADSVKRYGRELCLSAQELDQYVEASGKTASDEMLVLRLRDAIKYVRALKCSMRIDSNGEYMTEGVFSSILAENS